MPKKNDIELLQRAARLAPFPDGTSLEDIIQKSTILAFDADGRVFQFVTGEILDATWRQVSDGRTAVLKLLDDREVHDVPQFMPGASNA